MVGRAQSVGAQYDMSGSDPQRVHKRGLLQLHAFEAHLKRATTGAVWAPAQEVSPQDAGWGRGCEWGNSPGLEESQTWDCLSLMCLLGSWYIISNTKCLGDPAPAYREALCRCAGCLVCLQWAVALGPSCCPADRWALCSWPASQQGSG